MLAEENTLQHPRSREGGNDLKLVFCWITFLRLLVLLCNSASAPTLEAGLRHEHRRTILVFGVINFRDGIVWRAGISCRSISAEAKAQSTFFFLHETNDDDDDGDGEIIFQLPEQKLVQSVFTRHNVSHISVFHLRNMFLQKRIPPNKYLPTKIVFNNSHANSICH